MSISTKSVLNIDFVDLELDELVEIVAERIDDAYADQAYLVTPNPEIMLQMWQDGEFEKIVGKAWLRLADGFGLQWADWWQQKGYRSRVLVYPSLLWFALFVAKERLVKRVTGTDFMAKFLLWQKEVPVYLLGAAPGVAEDVVKEFPFAKIVGTSCAGPGEVDLEAIDKSGAKVLFVAYGAPKQELWLAKQLASLPSIKVAIGVGGAFDYLAGRVGRAPRLMRKLGLEWLYRLFKQPKKRIGRIWRAVFVFPWRVVTELEG